MKKLIFMALVLPALISCDFVLKDRDDDAVKVKTGNKVILGTDKDANGCVTSAGYKWSELRGECIRPFDEGYRLNTADDLKEEGMELSAFVIFEKEGNKAELFLPNTTKTIILTQEGKDAPYTAGEWKLQPGSGYILTQNGKVMYAGAAIEEERVVGDDSIEN
ncbi:hypothetical protein [Flavobacterium sp. MK4S-17]|uniref:hypothetical protein n=1 Tax=Flavobacterium sp. MK4S-17 TaxID=2543737 RepID=UPI001359013E|nr:hypothetical protein [Flavobacterium sp. MK4S-17]